MDYPQTSDKTFHRSVASASVVRSPQASTGSSHVSSQVRRSVRTACQGPLSIDETARLLRVDPSVVDAASRSGQLPTLRDGEEVLIDGPRLMSRFCQPAPRGETDAS